MTKTTEMTRITEFSELTRLVTIEGRPPGLLTNAVPEWAKENLLLKGEGKEAKASPKRTRREQFEDSLYLVDSPLRENEYGIPSDAFKQAMVRAAKSFKKLGNSGVKKLDGVQVQSLIFVGDGPDHLITVGGCVEPRADLISNSQGSKTAVIRAWFREWTAVLPLRFSPDLVNDEVVLQLLSDAGQGVGVGAWRRERGGHFGLWRIVSVV